MGPIVEPHGESFFTANSWMGTFANYATDRKRADEVPSVEYL